MPEPRRVQLSPCRSAYQDALAYLYGRIDYERSSDRRGKHPFRLERTEELFQRLGLGGYLYRPDASPQPAAPQNNAPKVPLVHIAGTKGKGSTATILSGILSAAGYRVGLYTSPHLTDLEERFRVNGTPCSRQQLVELVQAVTPVVDQMDSEGRTISFFELTTALALLHFDRQACEVIVLEVGLGGRLDSTNVCASTVAAVTSIGLDHQRVLGNTIAEIATEKAGIIKGGVPVVSGVTAAEARRPIRAAAERGGSPLFETGIAFQTSAPQDAAFGSEFVYQAMAEELGWPDTNRQLDVFLSLDGGHQVHNAAIAISIARLLSAPSMHVPLTITDQHIIAALRSVRCSGRLERFRLKQPGAAASDLQVIIDTAHNHDSILALCKTVKQREINDHTPGQFLRPIVAVFAISRDKDAASMASELGELADQIICTQFTTNPRAFDAAQLAKMFDPADSPPNFTAAKTRIAVESDPKAALQLAIRAASPAGTVIVCGSFFLAGELRPEVLALPNLAAIHCIATAEPTLESQRCRGGQIGAITEPLTDLPVQGQPPKVR